MSRRVTSPQALEAWAIVRDALANPDYCLREEDCESVTRYKLDHISKIRNAVNVVGSFIANPDRSVDE